MLKWITWVLYTAVIPPILLPLAVSWLMPRVGPGLTLLIILPIVTIYGLLVMYYYLVMYVNYKRRQRGLDDMDDL